MCCYSLFASDIFLARADDEKSVEKLRQSTLVNNNSAICVSSIDGLLANCDNDNLEEIMIDLPLLILCSINS